MEKNVVEEHRTIINHDGVAHDQSTEKEEVPFRQNHPVLSATITFVANTVGTGILTIPLTVAYCGIFHAIFWLIVNGFFSYFSMRCQMQCCLALHRFHYQELSRIVLGNKLGFIVEIAQMLSLLGCGAFFIRVVTDCIVQALVQFHWVGFSKWLQLAVGAGATAIMTIMACRRHLLHLLSASVLAVASALVVLFALFSQVMDATAKEVEQNFQSEYLLLNTSNVSFIQALPILAAAFSSQYNLPKIFGEVLENSRKNWEREDDRQVQGAETVYHNGKTNVSKINKDGDDDVGEQQVEGECSSLETYLLSNEEMSSHYVSSPLPVAVVVEAEKAMKKGLCLAIFAITIINICFGMLGVLAFERENILAKQGNIISCFEFDEIQYHPSSSNNATFSPSAIKTERNFTFYVIFIVRLLFALHVISIYPIYISTCRRAFNQAIYSGAACQNCMKKSNKEAEGEKERLKAEKRATVCRSKKTKVINEDDISFLVIFVETAIIGGIGLIGAFYAPGIGFLFGFTCAVFGEVVIYIAPVLVYLVLFRVKKGDNEQDIGQHREERQSGEGRAPLVTSCHPSSAQPKVEKFKRVALYIVLFYAVVTGVIASVLWIKSVI